MPQPNTIFDVTGRHISQLTDTDLRILVARLSEAELHRANLPLSALTAGGDQDAADGGIDVRVDLPPSIPVCGFIPRPVTCFQVKVPDMPRGAILAEMCPGGVVRPVLQELADIAGAYIIVSANSSTTDSMLRARREAMKEAVTPLPNAQKLALDFYDRDRLAIWVRQHPGLVAWVREQIGQPIRGWRPYANWASPNEGTEAEYLLDDTSRLYDSHSFHAGSLTTPEGLTIAEGIQRIRKVLADPQGIVRLVGLSGTGKTRLVQALFDPRIGTDALDQSLAIYTDPSDPPEPSPRDLLRRLAQAHQRAIVIIDNCLPSMHRVLAAICAEHTSNISLITVEFDVGEDEPEGTEVFRLEPASDSVIEHLLERQAPYVFQADRRRIAEFSGGNARMALALAHTVHRGDSVARLADRTLFERLFYQHNRHDESLMQVAEACSLVYSFDSETGDDDTSELSMLADLVSMTSEQLYRHVAELHSRGLIQKRGQWRAMLPPALANWLARQALDRIPPARIESIFLKRAGGRLFQSFTRRLGYLHDSEPARRMVQGWLAPGGLLSQIEQLPPFYVAMFENVAPVDPAAALDAIERIVKQADEDNFRSFANSGQNTWTRLLGSIAYDADLFPRAAILLARFAMFEKTNGPGINAFKQLFFIKLSGTHASVEQRLQVVDFLINATDDTEHTLGSEALNALLESWHLMGSDCDFGARSRDYGWSPTCSQEVAAWYSTIICYVQRLALSDNPLAVQARTILAKNFRGLWLHAPIFDELEAMARAIVQHGFWPEGWIAVRQTIRLHGEKMPSEFLERLLVLDKELRPNGLAETARAYLFSGAIGALAIANGEVPKEGDDGVSAYRSAIEFTVTLGSEVAGSPSVLEELLPEIVSLEVNNRVFAFGKGLAVGATDLMMMWQHLIDAFAARPEGTRCYQVLRGFLHGTARRDAQVASRILDEAINNPSLGPWFPTLQTAVEIGELGAKRLKAALQLPLATSWAYQSLACGRVTESIPSADLHNIILGIAALPNGYQIAVNVLGMRLHGDQSSGKAIDDELVRCGRQLLRIWRVEEQDERFDYELGEIVKHCFVEPDAKSDAVLVCRHLSFALTVQYGLISDYPYLLSGLLTTQPIAALDIFLEDRTKKDEIPIFWRSHLGGKNPLDVVPIEILVTWAGKDPSTRYAKLATVIYIF